MKWFKADDVDPKEDRQILIWTGYEFCLARFINYHYICRCDEQTCEVVLWRYINKPREK